MQVFDTKSVEVGLIFVCLRSRVLCQPSSFGSSSAGPRATKEIVACVFVARHLELVLHVLACIIVAFV